MTADQRGELPRAGGVRVGRRLLRRIAAARSGRCARADLEMHPGLVARLFATADERNAP